MRVGAQGAIPSEGMHLNNRGQQEQKARSNRRWNLITLAAFFIFAPAGVALFVAKMLDLLPNIGGELNLNNLNIRDTGARYRPDVWQKNDVQETKLRQAAESTAIAKKELTGMPTGNGAITLFGVITALIGAGFGLSKLVDLIDYFSAGNLVATAGWFSLAAAGVVFAVFGGIRKNKKRRFEAYLKLIGDKEYVSIHELADVLGMDYKKVIKDLKEMIQRGILNPAWIDMKTYRLMLTEYTGQIVTEKKEEYLPRSERILRQIRADNDLIADEEVSRKIDRIEDLTRKIFEIVDKYPEKENQLYSFLNYYLPTTLKTLESYARLEHQGIETASIREAKQKINGMLDELADGYEKQLDKLFENDVVDISADIEVMRQMLQKDGLTEDEIMKAKG